MKIPLYQVDAFTTKLFSGNPAAVCLLEDWLDDAVLQHIARENNLSETAFLVRKGSALDLRWFTPLTEVALCGHATLAAAYVLFTCKSWEQTTIRFLTRRSGELIVARRGDRLEMDFPSLPAREIKAPAGLASALGVVPIQVLSSEEDLLAILPDEKAVREVSPDFAALEKIPCRGVIVSAPGGHSDFVSRFFAPRVGVNEDPVTGSAHSVLIPYWAEKLGKNDLYALQVSDRGGELFCGYQGERVTIAGHAVLYLEGTITVGA
ncbi:MAG: PhzF family phenazine biosynthesis protein [Deltaproteobacteria bacterium]|nr:PhzF family phenazine biosynthesis protein [Deltaproteobacteria bacterium]